MQYDFDFFVIGAGSGGVRAARQAAGFGAKTGIAECSRLGGTCVNLGCVPKKFLFYASCCGAEAQLHKDYGWNSQGVPSFDWQSLVAAVHNEVSRLNGVYERLLRDSGVAILRGKARLCDAHSLEVAGTVYTARHILIAVGGTPDVPLFPGCEHVLHSEHLFSLDTLPESLLIVGGGYIATEFAGIFHGLGVAVTQAYRGELFLRGFDSGVRKFVAAQMRNAGIDLRFETSVASIAKEDDELMVSFEDGRQERFAAVCYATGRKPLLEGLGLENTKVELTQSGKIQRDECYRTAEPSIYAVGDVATDYALTPVAIREGSNLARYLFSQGSPEERAFQPIADVATAVFSTPNIGTVGLSEDEARAVCDTVDIYQSQFTPMRYALGKSKNPAFLKVVVDASTDRVLGFHMAGDDAPEIIQALAISLNVGLTKTQLDQTLAVHPTLAEEFVTLQTPRQD